MLWKIFALLLLLAAFEPVMAEIQSILDYNLLPACARSCKILEVSEKNCLPPAAPTSDNATYIDCLCHSEYLRKLHQDGELCHGICPHEDDIIVHIYFNGLCGTKPSDPISSAPTSSNSSAVIGAPSVEPVKPSPNDHSIMHQDSIWLTRHRIAFIVAISIVVPALILSIIVAVCLHRRRKAQKQKRAQGIIPLRTFVLHEDQLPDPQEQETRPRTAASSTNNLHHQPGTAPTSPLDPSGSKYNFADSLRWYDEDIRQQDEARARLRAVLSRPLTPERISDRAERPRAVSESKPEGL